MLFPRITTSGKRQKRSPSREVQMTSFNLMFIQLSHESSVPLKVSPFLSSTSWRAREQGRVSLQWLGAARGARAHHRVARRGSQQRERQHRTTALTACPFFCTYSS